MPFWIAAIALFAAVAVLILLALRRGHAAAPAPDLAVYRAQMAELDRDLTRGLVAPEEAAQARTEIARRILETDTARETAAPARQPAVLAGALVVFALLGSAFLIYPRLGAPGYPDLPLATRLQISEAERQARPSQAEMEAQAPPAPPPAMEPSDAALLDQLRATARDRPDDLQGQMLLARSEAGLGNYAAAARAQARVVALKAGAATAADHATQGELLIAAAGGAVSAEAETALRQALALDPQDPVALFHIGRMFDQVARPDLTFRAWRALLETAPADLPWLPGIREAMPRLAYLAGEDWTPPAPGPSAGEIEAAAGMSPEDRAAMIRGMVDRLSERMAREGGPPEDWARLISSLGVLGETEQARALWAEAQSLFASHPADLAVVRTAAEAAGVAP